MKMETARALYLEAAEKRRHRAVELHQSGLTFAQIGAKLGVSRQRAQAIVKREAECAST